MGNQQVLSPDVRTFVARRFEFRFVPVLSDREGAELIRFPVSAIVIPQEVKTDLLANRVKLAALDIPDRVGEEQATKIRQIVSDAFIFAFRRIMFVCALLAVAASACAWVSLSAPSAGFAMSSQPKFAQSRDPKQ